MRLNPAQGPALQLPANEMASSLNFANLAKRLMAVDLDVTETGGDVVLATAPESFRDTGPDASVADDGDIPFYQTFWCTAMADYMGHHRVKYEERLSDLRVPDRYEHAFDLAYDRVRKKARPGAGAASAGEVLCEGDRRVAKIRATYTRGFRTRIRPGEDDAAFRYITPSDDQLLFLEACLFASLPKIYGASDWATHHYRVLTEWGRSEIDYFLMMITARRVGKTFSMSMFDAAVLLHVPGITISVFSTGRRASKMLKELVEKLIKMTGDENTQRIINSNQEELFIAHKTLADNTTKRSLEAQNLRMDITTAKLFSYPSSVKGKSRFTNTITHSIHLKRNPPTAAAATAAALGIVSLRKKVNKVRSVFTYPKTGWQNRCLNRCSIQEDCIHFCSKAVTREIHCRGNSSTRPPKTRRRRRTR